MKDYRCRKCEYRFCSDNGMPYCPACDCEDLEEFIEEVKVSLPSDMESHHIWPRFMGNPKGIGEKFLISKRAHSILHGEIMNWLWEEVEDKKKAKRNIIHKSKKFIGVKK